MIREFDRLILRYFLVREAGMYVWKPDDGELVRRWEFINRLFKQITEAEVDPADFVHIQSLSNLGQVTSELVLTPVKWSVGKRIYVSLPPSPRGNATIHMKDDK